MTGREMLAVLVAALVAALVAGGAATALVGARPLTAAAWAVLVEGGVALLSGIAILGRAGMGKVSRIAFEYHAPWETDRHYELGASLGYVIVGVVLAALGAALLGWLSL